MKSFAITTISALFLVGLLMNACKKTKMPGMITVYTSSTLEVGVIDIYFDGTIKGTISPFDVKYSVADCGDGSVNITVNDEGNHTIKGVAADGSEWTRSLSVSEGGCEMINLTLGSRSKVPPPPSTTGNVVFWESMLTGCSATTDVVINGVTKQISSFSGAEPSCGASGNATFTLNPGSYTYTANCSGTQKTGTVTVTSGVCSAVQINWNTSTSTNGQVIFWENNSTGCSATTDVTINGVTKQISTFSASTPSCGASGNATFSLPAGNYAYTANCSGTQKTGTVTVSGGVCNPVQLNWTTAPPTNGQVVFWENSSTGCSATTDVTINGATKQITSFSASTPQCGSSGNATFSLAPGSYYFTASCSGTQKSGTVTVYNGICTPYQLNWNTTPPPPTTGQVVVWVQSDFACGPISVTINGVTRSITQYYGSTPNCDAAGCANFTLNPGVYAVTASCSGHSWNGSVTVTAGGCYKTELTL